MCVFVARENVAKQFDCSFNITMTRGESTVHSSESRDFVGQDKVHNCLTVCVSDEAMKESERTMEVMEVCYEA